MVLNTIKMIVIIIINLLITSYTFGQTQIRGYVYDSRTEKPINNVNVYLLGTLNGSATNSEGKYTIYDPPANSFHLVVSHVGYQNQKIIINIKKSRIHQLDFFLDEKLFELPQLTILDNNDEWRNNFRIFQSQFLGVLTNSKFSEILNPYIINFIKTEDNILKANTEEAIIIVNNMLGYKINYFLDEFIYYNRTTKYCGQPFFSEFNLENKNLFEFEENRKKAYCGSLRHFLYTAAKQYLRNSVLHLNLTKEVAKEDSVQFSLLEKQGFKVFTQNMLESVGPINPIYYPININDYISVGKNNSELILDFPNFIRVHYEREDVDELYYFHNGIKPEKVLNTSQISFIELADGPVVIDKTGYFFEIQKIHTHGYWGYDRIATMLPYEYELTDSILNNYDGSTN